MNDLAKDTLVIVFLLALSLFFGNLWAVQSDRQAEYEHQKITQYKAELNQNKEN